MSTNVCKACNGAGKVAGSGISAPGSAGIGAKGVSASDELHICSSCNGRGYIGESAPERLARAAGWAVAFYLKIIISFAIAAVVVGLLINWSKSKSSSDNGGSSYGSSSGASSSNNSNSDDSDYQESAPAQSQPITQEQPTAPEPAPEPAPAAASVSEPAPVSTPAYDESRVKYILLDIQLGGTYGYYEGYVSQDANAREAIARWDSGIRVTNTEKFYKGSPDMYDRETGQVANGSDIEISQ